jgi:hypothetical protein
MKKMSMDAPVGLLSSVESVKSADVILERLFVLFLYPETIHSHSLEGIGGCLWTVPY